jgi:hypothetical protein
VADLGDTEGYVIWSFSVFERLHFGGIHPFDIDNPASHKLLLWILNIEQLCPIEIIQPRGKLLLQISVDTKRKFGLLAFWTLMFAGLAVMTSSAQS